MQKIEGWKTRKGVYTHSQPEKGKVTGWQVGLAERCVQKRKTEDEGMVDGLDEAMKVNARGAAKRYREQRG